MVWGGGQAGRGVPVWAGPRAVLKDPVSFETARLDRPTPLQMPSVMLQLRRLPSNGCRLPSCGCRLASCGCRVPYNPPPQPQGDGGRSVSGLVLSVQDGPFWGPGLVAPRTCRGRGATTAAHNSVPGCSGGRGAATTPRACSASNATPIRRPCCPSACWRAGTGAPTWSATGPPRTSAATRTSPTSASQT